MYGPYIEVLRHEWRSRHEGNPPPPEQLAFEPWIGGYLRLMFPAPVRLLDVDPLCACGHDASEHPLDGACASCGCLGYTAADGAHARQEAKL